MDKELEALRALKPKKPPSKQRKIEIWFDDIEKKRLEDGATLEEIRGVLFPEMGLSTFTTMLSRARKKLRPASPSGSAGASLPVPATSAGPDSVSAKSGQGRSARRPSRKGPRLSAEAKDKGREEPGPICSGGGGGGESQGLKSKPGSMAGIEPQDHRIPPPWSAEEVDISEIPHDLPQRELLAQCQTWLEVHHFIKLLKDERYRRQTWSKEGLMRILEAHYPDDPEMAV